MSPQKTISKIALATLAAGLLPMTSSADVMQTKTIAVSLDGIDLTDASDVDALLVKISSAAERACTLTGNDRKLAERMRVRACKRDAIDQAVASLNSPLLSAALQESRS